MTVIQTFIIFIGDKIVDIKKILDMRFKRSFLTTTVILAILIVVTTVIGLVLLAGFIEGLYKEDNPWVVSIVCIFIGVLVTALYSKGKEFIESYKGWMSGNWTLCIYDSANNPIKEDLYMVEHRGDNIMADIFRTKPDDEAGRQWTFSGRLVDNTKLIGHYWSKEEGDPSCGAELLLKIEKFSDNKHINGRLFTGKYIKANVLKADSKRMLAMDSIQIPNNTITWQSPATNIETYRALRKKEKSK